jgi:hypothetical protein
VGLVDPAKTVTYLNREGFMFSVFLYHRELWPETTLRGDLFFRGAPYWREREDWRVLVVPLPWGHSPSL